MAPVLQCPDCGTKHPLASVPDAGTFPCRGCGRALKVPEVVPGTARSSAAPVRSAAAPPSPVPEPAVAAAPEPAVAAAPATRTVPVAERSVEPPRPIPTPVLGPTPVFAPVPLWMRFILWVVALPLSFFVVFLFARATGLFTSSQLSDVFLANGAARFWPVIRILPFVALVMAGLVHGGVYAIARQRGRRRAVEASMRGSYRSH
jgi:hypothetical protein